MDCPKCHSNRVKEIEVEGVTLDYCRECCGIWFDEGELAFYTETEKDIPHLEKSLSSATEIDSHCPKCSEEHLVEFPYFHNENLFVDFCRNCHGVFLDSKEILKVEQLAVKHKLVKLCSMFQHLKKQGYVVL